MNDPDYLPPKTDPALKGAKPIPAPKSKVSTNKVMLLTFLPSLLMLFGGITSSGNSNVFEFISVAAPILAFIFSIFTAIELSKGKEPLIMIGYWILFVIVHIILLFIGLFVGCGIASSGSSYF